MFYIYNGDRDVESMISFITADYIRSPRRELPRALDYRSIKKAQKKKKKLKQNSDDIELMEWIPDISSPSFMIGVAVFITALFLTIGYCCAPTIEEEKEGNKDVQDSKDVEKQDEQEKTSEKNNKKEKSKKTEPYKNEKTKGKEKSKPVNAAKTKPKKRAKKE